MIVHWVAERSKLVIVSIMFFRAIMNITEEFNRQKITEIKDKLIYDIEQINKGIYLNQTDSQTDYMNEIVICSDEIQSLRNKGVYNALIKKLEEEWKQIFNLVKNYDMAVKKFNACHKEKIKTFKERTGGIICENFSEYFPY